jgi:hypothetical protein
MTMPPVPPEILEARAAEQRRALHNDVQQLRSVVESEVRERMDLKKNLLRYFGPIAGAAALVGLSLGYGVAGIFTRD